MGMLEQYLFNTLLAPKAGTPVSQGGYTPAQPAYDPSTAQRIDPGVPALPASSASFTPYSLNPAWQKWDLMNGGELTRQLMAANSGMAASQLGGQQNFALQNNLNPSYSPGVSGATQMASQVSPSAFESNLLNNIARGSTSMGDYLKQMGMMNYEPSIGSTAGAATVSGNQADTSGNVNRNIFNKAQTPFQSQLGQILARYQQAQGQAGIAQSGLGETQASQQMRAMQQNPKIASQMYQMQPEEGAARISQLYTHQGFPGSVLYNTNPTNPTAYVEQPAQKYTPMFNLDGSPQLDKNGQPVMRSFGTTAIRAPAAIPLDQPIVLPPNSSEGWVNRAGQRQQSSTTSSNPNAGGQTPLPPFSPPVRQISPQPTTAMPMQGGAPANMTPNPSILQQYMMQQHQPGQIYLDPKIKMVLDSILGSGKFAPSTNTSGRKFVAPSMR